MVVTMSGGDAKAVESGVTIVSVPNSSSNELSTARNRNWKFAFLTCTVIIVILLIATATILAILNSQQQQNIQYYRLQLTFSDHNQLQQEETTYTDDNVFLQHVLLVNNNTNSSTEFWLLTDFNRETQIMKVSQTGSEQSIVNDGSSAAQLQFVCFVSPLQYNITDPIVLDSSAQQYTPSQEEQQQALISATSVAYQTSTNPITDTKSILGSSGMELCSGSDAYWAWPMMNIIMGIAPTQRSPVTIPVMNAGHARKRRSGCWALQCSLISYSNSFWLNNVQYVSCSRVYRSPCTSTVG